MGTLKAILIIVWIITFVNLPCISVAGKKINIRPLQIKESYTYTKDRISLQVVTGALFSSSLIGIKIPDFDYSQTNFRLGWMLSSPESSKFLLRGNFEAVLELSNSIIFSSYGNYMGGLTALLRYNFVQQDSRFIPYIQGGAGIVYTDAYRDDSQSAIGNAINFTPQASMGFRYLVDKNWSIDVEATYQHISNAGLDDKNDGVNALGGFIGLTYFYDNLWE